MQTATNAGIELPEDVKKDIRKKAMAYAKSHGKKGIGHYALNYEAGATEYARQTEEAKDLLEEAVLQIEYLHKKFKETGSGNNVLSRIKTFLEKGNRPVFSKKKENT